jgi:hypothetical protein
MATLDSTLTLPTTGPSSAVKEVPFGVNEVRLNARQWAAALLTVATVLLLTPWIWSRVERFETGPDYRLPYQLSNDYWLYGRRLGQIVERDKVLLLGDSVVWGEYVAPDGTLAHFLNEQDHETDRFVNLGLNGLFPLAEEGLITYYGQSLRHEKIVIQFNFLWLTSPKADLSSEREEHFNHSRLVPQFQPRIPCYRADANQRLGFVIQRSVPFLQWVGHMQDAYFGQKSVPSWTLEDDGGSPPRYPNSYRNPLAQISLTVPSAPEDDPERGPDSPRHKPWSAEGQRPTRFQWVNLADSLQWRAFQRLVNELRARGNAVFVVLGPFNEHMVVEESRATYCNLRSDIGEWLKQNQIAHSIPETLPSELYADASHPLTEGYRKLAECIYADPQFRSWLPTVPTESKRLQERLDHETN